MIERFHFKEIDSTNNFAKELIKDNSLISVSADYQTSGKGRNGRSWEGSFGKNIYLSIGINHNNIPAFSNYLLYQALATLSVINVLESEYPKNNFYLKYPNDIYCKEKENLKKISGILIESSFIGNKPEYTIIGIGINCGQVYFGESLSWKASSLMLLGLKYNIDDLIVKILEKIEFYLDNQDIIFKYWLEKLSIKGKMIKILGDVSDWQIIEVLNDCRLKLSNGSSEKIISDGESIIYNLE